MCHDWYARQSTTTDPGDFAERLGEVPPDPPSMRRIAQTLVFHYRAGGPLDQYGIEPERIAEIDLRYASVMFDRLVALAERRLGEHREPAERVVGCCRDFTLLFLSIARHHGWSARARVGFATYFEPGWYVDHVVAELWDPTARRWRLVEPQLADGFVDPVDGTRLDLLDVPSDRFLTGARAWRLCRRGELDPERFVVSAGLTEPGLRSWRYLRHNLLVDLAALNKIELLLWSDWETTTAEPDADRLELLDHLADEIADPRIPVERVRELGEHPALRVPERVISQSPASGVPRWIAGRV